MFLERARPGIALAAALAAVLATHAACARSAVLRGTLADSTTHAPISGVQVRVVAAADSAEVRSTFTSDDGAFRFAQLPAGRWVLQAMRMGYLGLRRTVVLADRDLDLGTVAMSPLALRLQEVVVKSSPPPALQVADTTEFYSRAVQTHPDANAEDLVTKMPGMTVSKAGTVKSNGETIEQVLVNGKPYFGMDPTVALRNLPASVIEKIQVFDKLSDQAEYNGFDDGETTKTMNVVLRPDHAPTFGKAWAGKGGDGRYHAGGHLNSISNASQFAVIGLSNNTNQQNFSTQDLLGVLNAGNHRGGVFGGSAGRRFAGEHNGHRDVNTFLVGAQDGITTTNALGAHADVPIAHRVELSQSYFVNAGDNHNQQDVIRHYAVPLDSATTYTEQVGTTNRGYNHRFDGRITWMADSTLIDEPRLYLQGHHAARDLIAENDLAPGQPLDQTSDQSSTQASGHNLSNHLLLQHRFGARRRSLSFEVGTIHTLKEASESLHSTVDYGAATAGASGTLEQRSHLHTTSTTLDARLIYTEPVGSHGALRFSVAPELTESQSTHSFWQPDSAGTVFGVPVGSPLNIFRSVTASQGIGLGYIMRSQGLRLSVHVSLRRTTLQTEREEYLSRSTSQVRYDVLPSFVLNDNLPNHRNLRVSLTTTRPSPTIGQLQDVVDNANPLALTIGNPALQPQYVQSLLCRYSTTDPVHSRSLFLGLSLQRTIDAIGLDTQTARRDTTILGVPLRRGVQLIHPLNLTNAWSASSFASVSLPAAVVRSLLNVTTGATWNRTPGMVNQVLGRTDVIVVSQSIVLASNVSPALDFTFSYNGEYNMARATSRIIGSSNYFTQEASLRLNMLSARGFLVREEVNHTLLNGVTNQYGMDVVLWNCSVGQKLFRNRLDLRLTATDVLAQNRSASRTVTEAYVQDTRNVTLPRHLMLTATYTWGQ